MSYYQTIYDGFRQYGLTEAGALGFLGNFDCESNCEPNRVQGDFSPYRSASKEYTADVDSGKISREQFKNDSKGYGLAQFTYFTRKAALYDFHVAKGLSIGDCGLQIDFVMLELKSDFLGLFNLLKTSNDLYECVKQICYVYENPAVKNVDARYQAAIRIKNEIDLDPQPVPPEPTPTPPEPVKVYWPPRTIDFHCTDFPESAAN